MATYRRLTVGARPVVVCFPEWLRHDEAVDVAYRALRRALGPIPTYVDAAQVVLVIPVHLLEDEEAAWALHALQDEITVWRLSTADGSKVPRRGAASDPAARATRFERSVGRGPMVAGWEVA